MGGTYCYHDKISFRIEIKNSNSVTFEIIDMDERFRSNGVQKAFTAKNGMIVLSEVSPAMYINGIFLRGTSKTLDRSACNLVFPNYIAASLHVKKIEEALKDWSENWEGWNKPPALSENNTEDPSSYMGWGEAARNTIHDNDSTICSIDADGIEDLKEVIKEKDKKIRVLEEEIEILKRYLDEYRKENEQFRDYIKGKPDKIDIY